jgi:HK97 family phage prohead protease
MTRFTAEHVPNVSTLHPAFEGEGLLLSGYASTWALDREGDRINPFALDQAVKQYMSTNPVLLYSHKMSLPPVGKILKARIDRARGLWVEALMPKPAGDGFAAEVWDAARSGLLKAFSLGASWLRSTARGFVEIIGADLREISICSIGVNGETYADSVTPTQVKCLPDGGFVRVADWAEYKALTDERNNLDWLAAQVRRRVDLEQIRLAVAKAHLGLRSDWRARA